MTSPIRHSASSNTCEAHIPGRALRAPGPRPFRARRPAANGRHPLPEAKTFIAWLGKQGLKPTDTVVCYDGGAGRDGLAPVVDAALGGPRAGDGPRRRPREMAARRPAGHRRGAAFPAATYPGKAKASMHASLAARREETQARGTDRCARAGALPRREEPIDPVAGRIPGAKNRFNNDNLSADGVFKSPESLRAGLRSRSGRPELPAKSSTTAARRRRLPQRAGDGNRGPDRLARLHRLLERVVGGPDPADLAQRVASDCLPI